MSLGNGKLPKHQRSRCRLCSEQCGRDQRQFLLLTWRIILVTCEIIIYPYFISIQNVEC